MLLQNERIRGMVPAYKVLLVAGQSNAVGDADASTLPSNLQTIDSACKIWDGSKPIQLVNGNGSNNPIDYPATQKWGPEAEFLRQYRIDNPSDTVLTVKHAVGGTQLAVNASGTDWSPSSTGKLFDEMTSYINAAIAAVQPPTVSVLGLLWMQGENDASFSSTAPAYGTNLAAFITAVGANWHTSKIVIGRITTAWSFASDVRTAQLAAANNPNVMVVNTDNDVSRYPLYDFGHYQPPTGIVNLGADMYAAWKNGTNIGF